MESDLVKILFTGDFCPINRIEDHITKKDFNSIFKEIDAVFNDTDLNVVDLECPFTISSSGRVKIGPLQKANPDTIKLLKHFNIGLCAMANNHIMDYNAKGLNDTIKLLKDNNIDYLGIGKTLKEASSPYSLTIKGKKIAFINYTDQEFITTEDGSFTCNPIDEVSSFYDVTKVKDNHDFVILIIHGGNEHYELPSPRIKKLYHYLVDLGADAIISHHTHCYSGYEVYNGSPIFYGLGNFIYDWPEKRQSKWNNGILVKLLVSDKLNFEIIPFIQNNHEVGVELLSDYMMDEFQKNISLLNNIIADDNLLDKKFQIYCESVFPRYDNFIEPYFGKIISSLRTRRLFPKLMNHRKRLLLLNLIRCESHREVLLRLLKRDA